MFKRDPILFCFVIHYWWEESRVHSGSCKIDFENRHLLGRLGFFDSIESIFTLSCGAGLVLQFFICAPLWGQSAGERRALTNRIFGLLLEDLWWRPNITDGSRSGRLIRDQNLPCCPGWEAASPLAGVLES